MTWLQRSAQHLLVVTAVETAHTIVLCQPPSMLWVWFVIQLLIAHFAFTFYFFFVCSEHDFGEDDIYDCVPCEDDGDDIYEDIIKVEVRQPMVRTPFCFWVFFITTECHVQCERGQQNHPVLVHVIDTGMAWGGVVSLSRMVVAGEMTAREIVFA